MTTAIAIIILIACGFLYYGWIRLRQEISAKITQLIFRKAHREGEGGGGQNTPHHPEISVCSRTP